MSQQRYFNFGSPASASNFNAVMSGITSKGILKGGEISIIQPNVIVIDPVWLIFSSGIVLHETERKTLLVPFSSSPTNQSFTVTYRHSDGGLVGGNAATLQIESGFISNENPLLSNGVALAYISYPGSGPLLNAHIIQAPRGVLTSTTTTGDGDFRLPPFSNGFITTQTSGAPVTPTIVDHGSYGLSYEIPNATMSDMTHVFKFLFVANSVSPKSVITDFKLGLTSTLSLAVLDTLGTASSLVVTDLTLTSGLTRRTARITDGTFISGQRYSISATILTKAGSTSYLSLLGSSEYNLPV